MDAPLAAVADIFRAGVTVVAILGIGPSAFTPGALVAQGTQVPIITGRSVGRRGAPEHRIAGIVGAGISVIACEGIAGLTATVPAGVVDGARVAVIAGQLIGQMCAAALRVAGVIGAVVPVIAVHGLADAEPLSACVGFRAGVVINTGRYVEDVLTTAGWRARVICADTPVVAFHRFSGDTGTARA